jgi:alkanesulfonate monooxygenase SsuD/methylene tetrahydromethanopterin reductase-like flavin-dependent oxidoreductase (luciferase family)
VQVDVLLDSFGSRWPEIRDAALAAERAGLDGVWLNDHLAGSVEGAPHVLECWTVLSALAAEVPRIALGPLVLNVANRDPGTLAVMAATLQQVSGGRLLLGLGAGARPGSSFALEQEALGRRVPSDQQRRGRVERAVAILHQVWSGVAPPVAGFLRPDPVPPIVIAGSGGKMSELAGRVGDGVCVPVGSTMGSRIATARRAYADSGRHPERLLVTATAAAFPDGSQPWEGLGLDRLIVPVSRPFDERIAGLGKAVNRWRAAAEGEHPVPWTAVDSACKDSRGD